MKVLYVSEWYPHRYDAMSGLFVRKHAQSVAFQEVDVCVLYVYPTEDKSFTGLHEIVDQHTSLVREVYVYYRGCRMAAMLAGWKYIKRTWGMPDVTQVNVITKNALLAIWLKYKYGIPYIVIEHWTGYLPENPDYKGFFHTCLTQHVAKNAHCVMPVSNALQKAMVEHNIQANYQPINNVVDDFFYLTDDRQTANASKKTLLHISCFDDAHKNISGILHATKKLLQQRNDFQLVIVGTGPDFCSIEQLSKDLLIEHVVRFVGEQTPEQVQQWFQQCGAFVFFSNYETAGVVLSESLACGKPIISTPVGIAPDIIHPETGVLVEKNDIEGLCNAMAHMLDHAQEYDSSLIRRYADAYSYEVVGKHLKHAYKKSLGL